MSKGANLFLLIASSVCLSVGGPLSAQPTVVTPQPLISYFVDQTGEGPLNFSEVVLYTDGEVVRSATHQIYTGELITETNSLGFLNHGRTVSAANAVDAIQENPLVLAPGQDPFSGCHDGPYVKVTVFQASGEELLVAKEVQCLLYENPSNRMNLIHKVLGYMLDLVQ